MYQHKKLADAEEDMMGGRIPLNGNEEISVSIRVCRNSILLLKKSREVHIWVSNIRLLNTYLDT